MKRWNNVMLLAMTLMLLAVTALPAYAATDTAGLPPIPEWPIIGPVLRWLGIVPEPEAPVPVATPDPDLPEYRISSAADLKKLWTEVPRGEMVRVVVTDDVLNDIARKAIEDREEVSSATVHFGAELSTMQVQIARALLEKAGVEIPIKDEQITAEADITFGVESCHPVLSVENLQVNSRKIKAGSIAERAANRIIAENWPAGACITQIIVLPGEIAVEGRYTPEE